MNQDPLYQTPPPVQPPVPVTPVPSTPPPEQPPAKSHRKLVWIIIAVFVIGIAVVAGVLWWHPWQQTDELSKSSQTTSTSKSTIDTASLGSAYDSFYRSGVKEFAPQDKDQTLSMYSTLTSGFALDDDFQKDQTNLLLSLGIAWLATQDSSHQSDYRSEMFLLMANNLSTLPDGIVDNQFIPQGGAADQKTLSVFSKYQDTDLTNRVQKALKTSKVYAAVASSLHLANTHDLEKVHVIAMNFESFDNQQFAREHDMYGMRPTMWAELVDHEPYILLTKDYAQSFLDEPTGSAATKIEHELVHTQNAFVRGELGRSIEERRAEEFSGDHGAYYDVKQLFIYINIFSGIDVYDMLQQNPIDSGEFYLKLYSTMGVRMANQVIATWPSAFLGEAPKPVTDTLSISGGLDGVIKSAVALGKHNQAAVDKRMRERVDKLMSVFGSKDKVLSDIQNNLGEAYDMPTAAAAMKKYINNNY